MFYKNLYSDTVYQHFLLHSRMSIYICLQAFGSTDKTRLYEHQLWDAKLYQNPLYSGSQAVAILPMGSKINLSGQWIILHL